MLRTVRASISMTYGDRMSARHRRPDDPGSDESGRAGDGPLVSDDGVRFRVADGAHALTGVRLEVDWLLGDVDPEFAWTDGTWSLDLPRPAAWRLEYQFTVRRDGDSVWTTDPGNPRRVPNPFGDKSEIRFPEYREPSWLLTPGTGPVTAVDTPGGRLTEPVPVTLWSPAGLAADTTAPLLLVHDGSDMAARGSLLCWAADHARSTPIRVALLDPPDGLRDRWYSADPDYGAHLAEVVLPALTARVLTGPVIGLGASLGALAMLSLQRRHPGSISALALQSGSFFTPELDPQESGYGHFDRVCAAVRQIGAGPDRSVDAVPRAVPTLITCGAIEENRFNNEAMAAALRAQDYPVTFRLVPDAHTMIGWRDAWFPALDELISGLR
jgi:enterochelin esterase-like enzyme